MTPTPTTSVGTAGWSPEDAWRDEDILATLAIARAPGLGPVRYGRVIESFGSATRAVEASPAQLARVEGIGSVTAGRVAAALRDRGGVERELERLAACGARLLVRGREGYPPLLAELPDAPPVLTVRGRLDGDGVDRFPVGMVGSRRSTAYGLEQSARFAGVLGSAGLTIVSGGARGIDTAAHRGAMNAGGRTVAVLGCGIGRVYPPENQDLFDRLVAENRGAVVSELPPDTPPNAENFPARNRIISGLSLGVLVVEEGERSGALITARIAAEEHGREVMALPGRVDAPSSVGTNRLIKAGGAHLVTDPGDVLELLRTAAWHRSVGTHADRFPATAAGRADVFAGGAEAAESTRPTDSIVGSGSAEERVLAALDRARPPDEVFAAAGGAAAEGRAAVTVLEIRGLVRRAEGKIERRA